MANIQIPKSFVKLQQCFEKDQWSLDRINGSYHIFTKRGRRCIPVAFHGGTISPHHASMILIQARDERCVKGPEMDTVELEETTEMVHADRNLISMHISNPLTKHELDNKESKNGLLLQQKKDFESLCIGRQVDADVKECKIKSDLETVQSDITYGMYKEVIDSISFAPVEQVGNSSDMYEFNCHLLFYQIVAMSEYAFMECAFNSKAQRGGINDALSCAA